MEQSSLLSSQEYVSIGPWGKQILCFVPFVKKNLCLFLFSTTFLYCCFFNSIVIFLYIVVRFVVFACNCFGYWLSLTLALHVKVYWCQFSPNSQHSSWWKKHQKGFILGTLQFRRFGSLELRLFFP